MRYFRNVPWGQGPGGGPGHARGVMPLCWLGNALVCPQMSWRRWPGWVSLLRLGNLKSEWMAGRMGGGLDGWFIYV